MIQLRTDTPEFFSDLSDVIRLFYGDVAVSPDAGETVICHAARREGENWVDTWTGSGEEYVLTRPAAGRDELEIKRFRKRAVKLGLYGLLKRVTGIRPPWGALTGIRPTRLLYEAMEDGLDRKAAVRFLTEEFDVSPEKAGLLGEISEMQQGLRELPAGMFDLYIGIPFCTTRCAYCSFSSGEIGRGTLVEPYVQALLSEIDQAAALMREKGLRLRAGYIGGGTPTSIACGQLEAILAAAQRVFPGAVEWTVEAGRPDTIDADKLRMLRDHAVTRISVNPQTFSDETLRRIGRAHTGADTLRAYELARSLGFDDINMDLIAALPGETFADFERTLGIVRELAPESVTVHSLAIKRSSRLHERLHVEEGQHSQVSAPEAERMITYARETLTAGGWKPYYLYRQKYMAGNLENVGYARPGKACLYNIGNMEETASVLALGAGAITKWLFPRQLRIERAPNVKNIEQYIARVDEMVARKRALIFS